MNELSKQLMCVSMRNGVEIWIESERTQKLINSLETVTGSKFIKFENQIINTADIVGIFTAGTMEDMTRRKNGQWKCQNGSIWHDRGEKCICTPLSEKVLAERRIEAYTRCGKCVKGFIHDGNTAKICECQKDLTRSK